MNISAVWNSAPHSQSLRIGRFKHKTWEPDLNKGQFPQPPAPIQGPFPQPQAALELPQPLSPVVVEPGCVAGDDDVVGLLGDIVLPRVNGAALVTLVGVLVLLGTEGTWGSTQRGQQSQASTAQPSQTLGQPQQQGQLWFLSAAPP